MPNAYIDGPKIESVETKRALVKEVTDAMEKAYKFPRQAYVVTITENLPAGRQARRRMLEWAGCWLQTDRRNKD